jgi:hypothetical protein
MPFEESPMQESVVRVLASGSHSAQKRVGLLAYVPISETLLAF